jgi:hypothetical protein
MFVPEEQSSTDAATAAHAGPRQRLRHRAKCVSGSLHTAETTSNERKQAPWEAADGSLGRMDRCAPGRRWDVVDIL